MNADKPGSEGEHALQERYGTFKRAAAFYDKQMLDHLNPLMREYLERQEMMFLSTSDANGECDASFRAGPPGFVRVLDDRTVMYPEYRGNGVMASLGNLSENPHVGMLFVDFFHSGVGMHINGRARVIEHAAVEAFAPLLQRMSGIGGLQDVVSGKAKTPERWVLVDIVEAYIHCSKHIPILAHLPGNAGFAPPSGDHFKAKDDERPWTVDPATEPVADPDPAPVAESEAVAACPVEQFYDEPYGEPRPEPVASEPVGVEAYLEVNHGFRAAPPASEPAMAFSAPAPTHPVDELDYMVPPAWHRVATR